MAAPRLTWPEVSHSKPSVRGSLVLSLRCWLLGCLLLDVSPAAEPGLKFRFSNPVLLADAAASQTAQANPTPTPPSAPLPVPAPTSPAPAAPDAQPNPPVPTPPSRAGASPLPDPTSNGPTLQNPLLPDASVPMTPPGNQPKHSAVAAPRMTVTPETDTLDSGNTPQIPALSATASSYFRFQDQQAGVLPNTDPIARAAQYQALSEPEAMIDGVGGIPATMASALEENQLNASRKRFRIGPINITGPNIYVAATEQNTSNGNGSSSGGNASNGGNGVNGFQSNVGASFGLTLGELATGHYMVANYGCAYQYPQQNSQTESGGTRQPFTQQLSVLGEMDFAKVRLGLGVSFASLSGTNRDLGGDANRQLLNVSLTSTYQLTAKSSVDWDLDLPIQQVTGGIGSAGVTSTTFLNHQFSPKLSGGLGFVAGTENDQPSGSLTSTASSLSGTGQRQTFEQGLLRLNFVPSPFVTFSGTGGVEFRRAGDTQSVSPIFSLSAVWAPRFGTSVALQGNESTQNSASMADENFLSTSVSLSLSQRLGDRMTLFVMLGYEHASYQSTQTSSSTRVSLPLQTSDENGNRVDNTFTAQAGLNFNLQRGWSASLSYSFSDNVSTTDGFTSSVGQISLGYTF